MKRHVEFVSRADIDLAGGRPLFGPSLNCGRCASIRTASWQHAIRLSHYERIRRAVSSYFRMHSDLTFLLRPSRADPYNAAGNGVERLILWNDLDGLSAPQFAEISAKSEAVLGAVDNQAGKSLGLPSKVSDDTSASCPDDAL